MLSKEKFIAAFLAALYAFDDRSVDPNEKPKDVGESELFSSYDFIIVGGGTAGCVLANRLSENPQWTVLLLEAGGDENGISNAPWLFSFLPNTEMQWNYTTVKQKKACRSNGGVCFVPLGRVLGGTSTVSGMIYARGNPADFDEWAEMGNTGWSYDDVWPYFIKLENTSTNYLSQYVHRGSTGPINIEYPRFTMPIQNYYIQAGQEYGWDFTEDYNGYRQSGIGKMQMTIDGGNRESTARAYLNPIKYRENLHISKHSKAVKIEINKETNTAEGVEYIKNNNRIYIKAQKEIIISTGAIKTPQLLMVSGIGPKQHLDTLGIPVIKDLPVGKYLQDQVAISLQFKLKKPYTLTKNMFYNNNTIIDYVRYRNGPLSTLGYPVIAFYNVFSNFLVPNVKILFGMAAGLLNDPTTNFPKVSIASLITKSFSRGSVKLKSKDINEAPLVDPNYFAENIDFEVARRMLKTLIGLMSTPVMKSLGSKLSYENQPNCAFYKNVLTKFIDCVIKQYSHTVFYPTGSARMGPDSRESVVNPNLLVHGLNNLRVVDASIMPTTSRGGPLATTIMIAEKASDIIKIHHGFIII